MDQSASRALRRQLVDGLEGLGGFYNLEDDMVERAIKRTLKDAGIKGIAKLAKEGAAELAKKGRKRELFRGWVRGLGLKDATQLWYEFQLNLDEERLGVRD